jgi:hypothetical protein
VTAAADACSAVANFKSISATGKSIERLLNAAFTDVPPIDDTAATTKAVLAQSGDFGRRGKASTTITSRALAIFLYRIEVNRVLRAAYVNETVYDGQTHLPIDLHYLLIPFADNAEWEHQIVGRTLQCLEGTPALSGPLLYPTAAWTAEEAVHLIPEDLALDQVMRTFDSLEVDYRLCLPYVARVVRLDGVSATAPAAPSTVIAGIKPSSAP